MFEFIVTVFLFVTTLTLLTLLLQNQALFRAILVVLLGLFFLLLPIVFSFNPVLTISLMGIGTLFLFYALTKIVSLLQVPPQDISSPTHHRSTWSIWSMMGKFLFIRLPSLLVRGLLLPLKSLQKTPQRKHNFVYTVPSTLQNQQKSYSSLAQTLRKRYNPPTPLPRQQSSPRTQPYSLPTQQRSLPTQQHTTPPQTLNIQRIRNLTSTNTPSPHTKKSSDARSALSRLCSSHKTRKSFRL